MGTPPSTQSSNLALCYNFRMPNYRRLFIPNTELFITIVTNDRRPILIDNIEILRKSFKRVKQTYKFEIFACVILPDHMHLLLKPEDINEYPKIIRAIKYNFSQKINAGGIAIPPYDKENCRAGLPSCRKKIIWQRGYWEHTIRDEQDLNNHVDYIHYNPVKHEVSKNVKDWQHSSFEKFVERGNYEKHWGTYDDVKHIESMNYD